MGNNGGLFNRYRYRLSKQDIQHLTCFTYNESAGLLAVAFSNLPLPLKRHCVQVCVTAGQMAKHIPEDAIPGEMTRNEYINAVRYGCLYHDIGAYLVYNQHQLYPSAGERFLREQLNEEMSDHRARQVILETVQYYCERYDGGGYPDMLFGNDIPLHAGICAVANHIDTVVSGRYGMFRNPLLEVKKSINENSGLAFSPIVVKCFAEAYGDISSLYKYWRKTPPFWKNSDIKPLKAAVGQPKNG